MDDIKREELEKACKKEKDRKVRTRMVAVRMVHVLDMSVDEAANLQVRCPMWIRDWLRRHDEGGLEGLRDFPRCGRPRRITRDAMDAIVANVAGCRITPVGMQQYIRAQTGTSLHITYVRKIMRLYNLSPKVARKTHINRAGRKAAWPRAIRTNGSRQTKTREMAKDYLARAGHRRHVRPGAFIHSGYKRPNSPIYPTIPYQSKASRNKAGAPFRYAESLFAALW